MMNRARLAVGLQGVGIAERATQQAMTYARERKQGVAGAIIAYPDVKRMLLTMRALTGAARAICYATGIAIDRSQRAKTDAARKSAHERASLLTPIAKAFSTDIGNEVASLGVQVHGGMGYVEETGAAQHYRDARITTIYEGTTAIQANDLIGRKTARDGGAVARSVIAGKCSSVIAATFRSSALSRTVPTKQPIPPMSVRPAVNAANSAPMLKSSVCTLMRAIVSAFRHLRDVSKGKIGVNWPFSRSTKSKSGQ
jgi:hypothetical protein